MREISNSLRLKSISDAYKKMLSESIYDDERRSDTYEILAEFKDDIERGIRKRVWSLIPAKQYAYAVRKFSESEPDTFVFSDRLLNDWLDIIITNTQEIEAISNLTGREGVNGGLDIDVESVKELFPEEWKKSLHKVTAEGYREMEKELGHYWFETQVAYDVLDGLGFYEWAVLPDGGEADTDNGVGGVQEVLENIDYDSSPADKLVAINRCLDVFHRRSDWASAFIDGGKRTLSAISNGRYFGNR